MLASGRFELRPFAESDLPSFVEAVLESTATVGKWMPWAHPNYSTADAASWFAHCEAEWERGSSYEFGIFDAGSNTLVGGCGLNQFNLVNGFCNLGYWVRQSWQRQGAALAAVQALSQFAFAELKLGRVEIVVAQHNHPVSAWPSGRAQCESASRGIGSRCMASSPMPMSFPSSRLNTAP